MKDITDEALFAHDPLAKRLPDGLGESKESFALARPIMPLEHYHPENFGPEYGHPLRISDFSFSTRMALGLDGLVDREQDHLLRDIRDVVGSKTRLANLLQACEADMGINPIQHCLILDGAPALRNSSVAAADTILLSRRAVDLLDDEELKMVIKHECQHLQQTLIQEVGDERAASYYQTQRPKSLSSLKQTSAESAFIDTFSAKEDMMRMVSQSLEYDADRAAIMSGVAPSTMVRATAKLLRDDMREGNYAINNAETLARFNDITKSMHVQASYAEKLAGASYDNWAEVVESLSDIEVLEFDSLVSKLYHHLQGKTAKHPTWVDRANQAANIATTLEEGAEFSR